MVEEVEEQKEVYRREDKRAVLTLEQALEFKIEGAVAAYQTLEANEFLADHRGGFLIITPPPRDTIVYASSLARQYLGATEKDVVGMRYFDFIKDKTKKRKIRRSLLPPNKQDVRMIIETLEGKPSELSITKIPIMGDLRYGISQVKENAHLYTIARIQRVGLITGRHGEKLY